MDYRVKELLQAGDRIVDLGCGSGQILTDLGGCYNERIGLDVSRRRLDESKIDDCGAWIFREADLNGFFPIEDAYADSVIANQVIEHIVDPAKFVMEIYRILRPGGRCVITTPNIRYLPHIIRLLLSGYGPRTGGGNTLDGQWDDGHIHYFTHKDLREVFTNVGFSEVQSRALINNPRGNFLRRALDNFSTAYAVRELLSGNILLWAIK